MMPRFQLQITLFPSSNIVADASTNSWSVEADDLAAGELFKDNVLTFYQTMRPDFANTVRVNNHVWKLYDRDDPTPRAPIAEGLWGFMVAPAGNPLPPEVALCLSFEGLPTSGIPQARRRGRIYLGPLDVDGLAPVGRPTTTVVNRLVAAGEVLRLASVAAASWTWCVFSVVNDVNVPISRGWVDDEYDTQRRRGRVATVRTVFP